jgi:hypothetical protein
MRKKTRSSITPARALTASSNELTKMRRFGTACGRTQVWWEVVNSAFRKGLWACNTVWLVSLSYR